MVAEPESGALTAAVAGHRLLSSDLVLAELPRAVGRAGVAADDPALTSTLDRLGLVTLTRALLRETGRVGPPAMRTLDAIHLVSALAVGGVLDRVLGYDRRLLDAARGAGLAVGSPGAAD